MAAPAQISSHRDLIVWQKAMDLVESARLDEVAKILNGLRRAVEQSSRISHPTSNI